jgi:hypothetical protein
MSNYTKTVDFAAKDSLPSGDSGKIIKGTEFETEFDNIATAIATKSDSAGPTFTGVLTFASLKGTGATTVTTILDEDDMATDSATALATQQSIKAYVDAQQDTVDTLAEILALGNATGGTDIAFGDNDKAIFGAESDLQIYHTGTSSIIEDQGTGDLVIKGTDLYLRNSSNSNRLYAGTDVRLYYDGSEKIRTAATGIDVTGTVTADGLTVDGATAINSNGLALTGASPVLTITDSDTNVDHTLSGASSVGNLTLSVDANNEGTSPNYIVNVGGSQAFRISDGGDISFYNTAGDSQALFWDASTERLGIGNSAPTTALDVTGTATADALDVSTATGSASPTATELKISSSTSASDWSTTDNWGVLGFYSADGSGGGAGNRAEIAINMATSTGAFGSLDFTLSNPGSTYAQSSWLKLENSASSASRKVSVYADNGLDVKGGNVAFYEDTGTTPKLVWDASAESLGIGTDSPTGLLHLSSSAPAFYMTDTTNNTEGVISMDNAGSLILNADLNDEAASSNIRFAVDGSEAMRIDSAGNVGINVTDPIYSLEVQGQAGIELFDITTSGKVLNFRPSLGDANKYNMSISAYDHSGGGTSAADGLSINAYDGVSISTGSSTARQERMRITESGEVRTASSLVVGRIGNRQTQAVGVTDATIVLAGNSNVSGAGEEIGKIAFYNQDASGSGHNLAATIKAVTKSAIGANAELIFSTKQGSGEGAEALEAMRLTDNGDLLVGKTSVEYTSEGFSLRERGEAYITSDGRAPLLVNRLTSDGDIASFRKDGTPVGSISVTASATAYNTSSDQRLKENIADADDAGSKVDSIKVRKFDWIADGSHQDYGMIAQELIEVAPEAVSASEDPEEMMGVDYSKLVPMMLKEIQSLRARVAQLES